jgi:hypothetical protein
MGELARSVRSSAYRSCDHGPGLRWPGLRAGFTGRFGGAATVDTGSPISNPNACAIISSKKLSPSTRWSGFVVADARFVRGPPRCLSMLLCSLSDGHDTPAGTSAERWMWTSSPSLPFRDPADVRGPGGCQWGCRDPA